MSQKQATNQKYASSDLHEIQCESIQNQHLVHFRDIRDKQMNEGPGSNDIPSQNQMQHAAIKINFTLNVPYVNNSHRLHKIEMVRVGHAPNHKPKSHPTIYF